jgi:hypothetical protein
MSGELDLMLQIDRTSTSVTPDGVLAAELRAHFNRHHWVKLPSLFAPSLRGTVESGLRAGTFVEIRHEHVSPPSIDLSMETDTTTALLELLCNDPVVLRAVESMTRCAPLTRFSGFIYRLTPDLSHHHNWHNDLLENRRVAMSVNLEPLPYGGGILQIRERDTGRIIEEVENTGHGDAVLFRVDEALQHRVLPVTSGVKTAFAGWFRATDGLLTELKIDPL